jgi:hypothetical protein
MTNRFVAIASVLALLVGLRISVPAASAQMIAIKRTTELPNTKLTTIEKRVEVSGETFNITYVVVDPSYRIALALPQGTTSTGASLGRFFQAERPLAVLNGGFLRSYAPATPAGLLQIGGEEINALSRSDPVLSGVVCFPGRGPSIIIALAEFGNVRREYLDCLQGGPLLVYNGRAHGDLEQLDVREELKRFASRPAERSFIAKSARNETLLGITEPTSLFALRAVMLANVADGGFGAVAGIGLTGRTTAGLIVHRGGEPVQRGGTAALLPNAIVVRDQTARDPTPVGEVPTPPGRNSRPR